MVFRFILLFQPDSSAKYSMSVIIIALFPAYCKMFVGIHKKITRSTGWKQQKKCRQDDSTFDIF